MPSLVRFTNCVLLSDGVETKGDLYISETSGKIVAAPRDSVAHTQVETVDLGGRFLSPGLIDVQLNGCLGINFGDGPDDKAHASTDDADTAYKATVKTSLVGLLATGVTSFLPTLTTAKKALFDRDIPFYLPNGQARDPTAGAESLGIHCEGPFISPAKKGAHDATCLLTPTAGVQTIEDFYGAEYLHSKAIRKLTLAPELPGMLDAIRDLVKRHGTVVSLGHSAASYEQGLDGLRAGATMLTHTYNAMEPFLHRNPGLAGLVGAPLTDTAPDNLSRPFFGLIADAIHVHPSAARAAWATHEDGCIVTTDGTAATGLDLPDGLHVSKDGKRRVVKKGRKLFLEGTDTIAGGTTTLVQCVSNLIRWTGISPARALKTVTCTPAKMIGVAETKGTLRPGADADLVVLSWEDIQGQEDLQVHQVWKFGRQVV